MAAKGAFQGVTIIDLSENIAGSYAAALLAEQGADVVKVEPPGGGPLRGTPGFHVWNRGKRSITAVLAGEGRKELRRVISAADVVISDYTPDRNRQLGLTYEQMAETNPRVICCNMPPLGARGPKASTPANDDVVAAYGGLMASQWAYREGPVYLVIPLSSYGAALLAAGATGAALIAREATGMGQQLEVSWLAGALAMQFGHLCATEPVAESPNQSRDPLGGMSPFYHVYRASDDWLFVCGLTPVFFAKLCIALGIPELVSDPRCVDAPLGVPAEHHPALRKIVAEVMSNRTRAEWLRILKENDVPCAPVMTRQDFTRHPQVVFRGLTIEVEDPELGKTMQPGVPVHLHRTPGAVRAPAPLPGQHDGDTLLPTENARPHQQAGPASSREAALSGIRVVDFGTNYAGAGVGRLLADMGAEVVKVESHLGDPLRNAAYSFVSMNRGKRGLSVDAASEQGRSVIRKLLQEADVLIENFRPGVTRRLAIDYDTVRSFNPRIVYCSVTSFGTEGPYGDLPGYDPLTQALSGVMRAQGGTCEEPAYFYVGIMDHACALTAAFGVTAALYHRQRTGEGQLVETSILNAGFTVQSGDFVSYHGKPAGPEGGRDLLGISALRRLYRAQNGWLLISVARAEQWASLARAAGFPKTIDCGPAEALAASRDGELAKRLETLFASRRLGEWLPILEGAGVPCAPVRPYREIYYDGQIAANDLMTIEDHPEWGKLWVTGRLAAFSATPGGAKRGTPGLGQHTDEVLAELGFSGAEIQEMRRQKVVL